MAAWAPAGALAHHGAGTSRLGPSAGGGWLAAPLQGGTAENRIGVGLQYELTRYGRTLRGAEEYADSVERQVDAHVLRSEISAGFRSGTGLRLIVPFAALDASTPESKASRVGLSDVSFEVSQDLSVLYPDAPRGVPAVRGSLAVVLPTGEYSEQTVASVTELRGAASEIRLTNHDMRASLGSGALWLDAGLGLTWRLGRAVALASETRLRAPLTRTEDETRWGKVVQSDVAAVIGVVPEALDVVAGLGYRFREADDRSVNVPTGDGTSAVPSEPESRLSGGAHAVRSLLGARVHTGLGLSVNAMVEIPVFQSVNGVQLAESFSVSLGVTWLFSL